MINKGIIRNITDNEILVEPLSSDSLDGKSCGSGSCATCSHKGKVRLMKVINSEDLPLRPGNLVEFELPTSQALLGFFRMLLAPPLAFAILYYTASTILKSSISISVVSGVVGFSLIIGANILYRRIASDREVPKLVKVLY